MTTPTTDSLLIQANDRLQEAIETLNLLNAQPGMSETIGNAADFTVTAQEYLQRSYEWKQMKEGLHGTSH